METSRLLELADVISKATRQVHDHLKSNGQPFPSFDPDQVELLPEQLSPAQDAIIDAASELQDLLLGPFNIIHMHGSVGLMSAFAPRSLTELHNAIPESSALSVYCVANRMQHNAFVSLQAIHRFGIASKFSPGETVSVASLAESCGVKHSVLRSLLRHAMTKRIFCEPRRGFVAHTAASALLRRREVASFVGAGGEEMWPAALKTVDALQKWPKSEEPNETGFSLAHNTSLPMYEVMNQDASRAARFSDAMVVFTRGPGFDVAHVVAGFDWASLPNGTVVDIGGSRGNVGIALAKAFANLQVTVQDLANTVEGAEKEVPNEVKGRVHFEAHDMFQEQTVQADVYLLRWVLHNWSDKYCVKVLRALIPALKKGATVLINDTLMPNPGEIPLWREKQLRMIDVDMLSVLNAHERDAVEWRELFELADSRFEFIKAEQPQGSNLGFIEARWSG